MGQPIYVEVTGDVANGIMTLEASGTEPTQGGYYLHWDATLGFTGGKVSWTL